MLRPATPEDYKKLFDSFKAGAYPFFFRYVPKEVNLELFTALWKNSGDFIIFTNKKETETVAYITAQYNPTDKAIGLGLLIRSKYQGKCLAPKILVDVVTRMLANVYIDNIVVTVAEDDKRINKLVRTGGFIYGSTIPPNSPSNASKYSLNRYYLPAKTFVSKYLPSLPNRKIKQCG